MAEEAREHIASLPRNCGANKSLVQIAGLQPLADKQVIGVPVPGHSLKPAFYPLC